ncbi:hypothetical protein EDD11_006173 [Mortierella claussenii]|nr:hypothetical protein EDD11_006173 [Mortierella claussenii]
MSTSFPTPSYRPLQCPTCKELLLNPVTLPCGFTLCQRCLPPVQTITFQQLLPCPFKSCTRSSLHSPDQLTIDVTLQTLSDAIRQSDHSSISKDVSLDSLHQPNRVFYGSTDSDPSWDATLEGLNATLEGLNDPYKVLSAEDIYRNVPTIIDTIRTRTIQQEIECQVCFLVFEHPITTYCGHTFCKNCLITSLDHKPDCPLCRRPLPLYMFYHNQPPNKALVRFIQYLASRSTATSFPEDTTGNITLDEDRGVDPTLAMTPLFVNSLIFPRMPCYLLVFEPRYRKLLKNVLKTESKMFGMVLPPRPRKQQDLESLAWEPSMGYGTLLKVLSCELLPDGRALVETVGLSRFQILTYSMMDGYYAATAIELVHDIPTEQELGLERAIVGAAIQERESPAGSDDEQGTVDYLLGTLPKKSQRQVEYASVAGSLSGSPHSQPLSFAHPGNSPEAVSDSEETPRSSFSGQLGMEDLHKQDLEKLTQKQLQQILVAYVAHMQERLGALATQRLEREYGEMVEDDGQFLSFWVGSILPMRPYQKYELLKVTSVRKRLLMVLSWIKDIEARRSVATCIIS